LETVLGSERALDFSKLEEKAVRAPYNTLRKPHRQEWVPVLIRKDVYFAKAGNGVST
jgi:hypothetical protein